MILSPLTCRFFFRRGQGLSQQSESRVTEDRAIVLITSWAWRERGALALSPPKSRLLMLYASHTRKVTSYVRGCYIMTETFDEQDLARAKPWKNYQSFDPVDPPPYTNVLVRDLLLWLSLSRCPKMDERIKRIFKFIFALSRSRCFCVFLFNDPTQQSDRARELC